MVDYEHPQERLARNVRNALGEYNDPNEAVVTLVRKLVTALAEARQQPPEGWVMVPREPTQEMIKAAEQQWLVGGTNDMARREWHAMLAAAPPAPAAEPVAWADPQAFKNFKERGHLGGAHAREWMWAKPDIGLVPLYTAPPPVEASQQQAEGDCTWEHAANEWADVATNAVTVLENVRDGITSFEDAIASFKSWYESARASQPGANETFARRVDEPASQQQAGCPVRAAIESLRQRLAGDGAAWRDLCVVMAYLYPEQQADQRQQCPCGDRPASQCPGEWEPGCDLGANEAHARRVDEASQKQASGDLVRRLNASLRDLLDAMHAYELDVGDHPIPNRHRQMMQRAEAILSAMEASQQQAVEEAEHIKALQEDAHDALLTEARSHGVFAKAELSRLTAELSAAKAADANTKLQAESYEIACEVMEGWQDRRIAEQRDPGTRGSLIDGIERLHQMIEQREAEAEALRAALQEIAAEQSGATATDVADRLQSIARAAIAAQQGDKP